MKKTAIYILLIFYIAVQLKPFTVVVQDIVAHTFFKVQHMATVHYENGRYHIHKELKSINDGESGKTPQKAPASQNVNELLSNQIIQELHFNFKTVCVTIPSIFQTRTNISTGFSSILSPPPKTA